MPLSFPLLWRPSAGDNLPGKGCARPSAFLVLSRNWDAIAASPAGIGRASAETVLFFALTHMDTCAHIRCCWLWSVASD